MSSLSIFSTSEFCRFKTSWPWSTHGPAVFPPAVQPQRMTVKRVRCQVSRIHRAVKVNRVIVQRPASSNRVPLLKVNRGLASGFLHCTIDVQKPKSNASPGAPPLPPAASSLVTSCPRDGCTIERDGGQIQVSEGSRDIASSACYVAGMIHLRASKSVPDGSRSRTGTTPRKRNVVGWGRNGRTDSIVTPRSRSPSNLCIIIIKTTTFWRKRVLCVESGDANAAGHTRGINFLAGATHVASSASIVSLIARREALRAPYQFN